MSNPGIVAAYQQHSAQGASPIALVLSLYDTIIRDFAAPMQP